MNIIKFALVALAAACSVFASSARADDTDLYLINPNSSSSRPNILLVVDNTANWSPWFTAEMSALSSVFSGLSNEFNVGVMFFTETGSGDSNTDGAYIRAAIRQMSDTNRPIYASMINSLDTNGDKSNGAKFGLMTWEAWQYFTGLAPHAGNNKNKTDYTGNTSGTTASNAVYTLGTNALGSKAANAYNSPVSDLCGKNFIIVLTNGPANDNASDRSASAAALAAALGSTTAIPLSPSGQQNNVADEWARFMASHTQADKPHIYTYTVGVQPSSWASGQGPDMVALLQSMANVGKGKYFEVTSDASSIAEALNKIFAEILAVNSVFASVTLPDNLNVRGQSVNQIYMGVFRPDSNASPRWPGNLKQYAIGFTDTAKTVPAVVDRNGAAIEDKTNGFLLPNVTSYWSTITTQAGSGSVNFWDSSYYPDAQGSGVVAPGTRDGTADSPDGEMVEKGGAAQRLRGKYSYYSGAERVSNRNVYTCPVGACSLNTSLSTLPFATSNTYLTNAVLGLGSTSTFSSLTRGASTCTASQCTATATATTTAPHDFTAGTSITVSNAAESAFNGTFTLVTASGSTLTYKILESPAVSASGGTASLSGGAIANISAVTAVDSGSTRTVTVTTSTAHPFTGTTGTTTAYISGISPSAYSGAQTVTLPTSDSTHFTYTVALTFTESPANSLTVASTATFYTNSTCTSAVVGTMPITSVTRPSGTSSTTVTISSGSASNKSPNSTYSYVSIPAAVTGYGGCYACDSTATGVCKKNTQPITVTYGGTISTITSPVAPTATTATVSNSATIKTITTLTRAGSICGASTCTSVVTATSTAHGFTAGGSLVISGASVTEYNGTFTILSSPAPTTNTFSYSINTTPPVNSSGGQADSTSAGVTKADFINWIRGQNTKNEDNPSGNTSDVRGYIHGDVLHSRPSIINYNRSGQPTNRDSIVYYGANDGMLHAVKGGQDDTDGYESWSFVASEHYTQFQRMYAQSPPVSLTSERTYFFDGPITTLIKNINDSAQIPRLEGTGAKAQIFAGMRRGGRSYYGFDVTNPGTSSSAADPKFLWKITGGSAPFAELGYSWSEAKAAKIKIGTTPTDVLFFGGGYDPAADDSGGTRTMGRAVYAVNPADGSVIWKSESTITCSIAADLSVLDTDGDGYIDRVYAVDTCGNIWRINTSNADASAWTITKLADLGGDGRKFLYPPSVVLEHGYDVLLIGSGDREHPYDLTSINRFYKLNDSHDLNDTSTSIVTSDLCNVTNVLVSATGTTVAAANRTDVLTTSDCNSTVKKGWYIELCAGEKTVGGAVTLAGATYFSTNVPRGSTCLPTTGAQCTTDLGEARDYAVYYQSARPVSDLNTDGTITLADRYEKRAGGGFSPTGTPFATTVDGKQVLGIISGPKIILPPITVSKRRHRTYWHSNIDQ